MPLFGASLIFNSLFLWVANESNKFSLYISIIEHVIMNSLASEGVVTVVVVEFVPADLSMISKIDRLRRGIIPSLLLNGFKSPNIVYVFPELVTPYVKIVPLYPKNTSSIRSLPISLKSVSY